MSKLLIFPLLLTGILITEPALSDDAQKVVAASDMDYSITSILAIYAALISTIALCWNIYRDWQSGVILAVDLSPNMQMLSSDALDDAKLLSVNVRNIGNKPTTLTHLGIDGYNNSFMRLIKKPAFRAIIPVLDDITPPFPHLLDIGTTWSARIPQSEIHKFLKDSQISLLYVSVVDSSSSKPKQTKLSVDKLDAE